MAKITKRISRIASGIKDIGVGTAMMGGALGGTMGLRIIGSQSSNFAGLAEKAVGKIERGAAHVKNLGGDVSTYRKLNKKKRY